MIHFKNTYHDLPERFYQDVRPEYVQHPELLKFNHDQPLIFSGQTILEGSKPLAMAYAGMLLGC
jgi:uncharacterized protein YdiU (UPF0061 family)